MKYKEFKRAVEDWGRIYGYKPIINVASTYIEIAIKDEDYVRTICAIHKSERFVMYLHWELYRSLSENVKDHLFKIVTEFAATKPEEREDKKDNLDEIINRLEVIQTNLEEIQERSWNLRNSLEEIIIDLEEYKEKQELPYEITDMQGMFSTNNTDKPF